MLFQSIDRNSKDMKDRANDVVKYNEIVGAVYIEF